MKANTLHWHVKANVPSKAARSELILALDKAFPPEQSPIQLFVTLDNEHYTYLGKMELASMLAVPDGVKVTFYLADKLSLEAWEKFGSYSNWLLSINGERYPLTTETNLETVLAKEWDAPIVELYLTRYAGDRFFLVANTEYAFVHYVHEERNVSLRSQKSGSVPKTNSIISFVGFQETDWDVQENAVISKLQARSLLLTFFRTGIPEGLVDDRESA